LSHVRAGMNVKRAVKNEFDATEVRDIGNVVLPTHTTRYAPVRYVDGRMVRRESPAVGIT